MKRCIHALAAVFVLLAVSLNTFADQIILKNGDRLTGKIVSRGEDSITLETLFPGNVVIPMDQIEKILTDEDIAKLEEEKKEEPVEPEKVEEAKVEPPAIAEDPKTGLLHGWEGDANLGFSMTRGNADTTTLTSGIKAVKKMENSGITTYLNSLWLRNRVAGVDVTTANTIWGGIRYDRDITKKVFAFGSYDFERDKPKLINFRSVVGAGLGMHVIKNERTELDVFSGLAWNRTWFVGDNDSAAEALVGNSFKHAFNDRARVQQSFTFYQGLTGVKQQRFIFDATFSTDITKRFGWFVTFGDRYNSDPVFGAVKNDTLLATGIKWSFGKDKK